MAKHPDPFEYDEILSPSQLRVAVPIHQSGFLETRTVRQSQWSFQSVRRHFRIPYPYSILRIPDSRCVFLKRLLQKRRLQISHPSPWATSVSTGAAQHGGCIPLWRMSSPAGFIH